MVRADWRFELAHSYGEEMMRIGELSRARGKQIQLAHNRAGNLSFNYPLREKLADQIIRDETCIIAVKNDVPVWSGPVWQTKENTEDSRIQVTAVGWQTLLDPRFVRSNMAYSDLAGTDDAQIAFDLIDHANDHDGSLGLLIPHKVIDGEDVQARSISWIRKGSIYPGPDGEIYRAVPRRQLFTAWQNKIGPSIQQLSDIEDGFDYRIDPMTVELNIYRKLMTTRPNIIYGLGAETENLLSAQRDGDSSKALNFMRVLTAGGIVNVPANESIERIGYREDVANLADVQLGGTTPEDRLNIGAAYGAEETTLRMWGETVHVIQPKMLSSSAKNVPSIFEDFFIGDQLCFVVDEGRFVTNKEMMFRLFGATIAIDEESNEKITNMQIYWGGS